jgi:hypothetical protein
MTRLQHEIDASWDEDACECGAVYRISEGHTCSTRARLRGRTTLTSSPFLAKPVTSVRRPRPKKAPKDVPRRRINTPSLTRFLLEAMDNP